MEVSRHAVFSESAKTTLQHLGGGLGIGVGSGCRREVMGYRRLGWGIGQCAVGTGGKGIGAWGDRGIWDKQQVTHFLP